MSTAASPPDPFSALEGRLLALNAGARARTDGPRSYDDLGRCWSWVPAIRQNGLALDVERLERELDRDLPRRWAAVTSEGFLRRWTVAEVVAKLQMTPVMAWLDEHGLPALPDGEFDTVEMDNSRIALRHFVDDDNGLAVTVGHRTRH